MIKILKNVLSDQQIDHIYSTLNQGQFYSGKETAGWAAQSVKNNLQWAATPECETELSNSLTHALVSHPQFSTTTYAKNITPFLVSETSNSGGYGNHIDNALMGEEAIIRSDMSCTVFLSDPESYKGGALVMTLNGMDLTYKLPAGYAIVYPSSTLHRVEPVTEGKRQVAVTWIESFIRNGEQREILNDLDLARREIMSTQGKSSAFDQISKSHSNLLRLWAET
ncbi:Fe2+-dependent dioxygenase [Marinomonas sp. 5E14-1]|uniref:Fe2+-dependent dioxygenase n=1 Tax=Marinomonas sp. 5E14-1 TaxID=3153922 RepID=UPI003265473F